MQVDKRLVEARVVGAATVGNLVHGELRTLELVVSSSSELTRALGAWRCPKLRSLTISGAWTEPLRPTQVALPALEQLRIDPSPATVELAAEAPFAKQLTRVRFTSPPSERTVAHLHDRRAAFPRLPWGTE